MKIVFENNDIIAINKNAGIPSQPDLTKDKSVYDYVKYRIGTTPYILNRIDRPVSGLVLFAKNKKAATFYSNIISNDRTIKTYYAIVENKPFNPEGHIETILIKKGNKAYISKDNPNGKNAILDYKYIGCGKKYHYLKIKLSTGRFHQIRAQLAHIGCHIKGDIKYGARRANKDRSICLHAFKYELLTTESLNFKAEFPDSILWKDLASYIKK